jgi:hypothetical protein
MEVLRHWMVQKEEIVSKNAQGFIEPDEIFDEFKNTAALEPFTDDDMNKGSNMIRL